MNEDTSKIQKPEEAKAQRRVSRLQCSAEEVKEREEIKSKVRKEIVGIREGHTTGGYCDTKVLQEKEKELHHILRTELEELSGKEDYASQQQHKLISRELGSLSWKPKLVVADNQD